MACEELVEEKDACNCSSFRCEKRKCSIPQPIVCDLLGPCDKAVTEKDACGCEILRCQEHICTIEPDVNCSQCHFPKTERDSCGCYHTTCKSVQCAAHNVTVCDKCHDLFVGPPDTCGCRPPSTCVSKQCPMPVTPVC